jgi:hypothetical protein
MGEEALDLSAEDLELAMNEVKAAIDHHLEDRTISKSGWMPGKLPGTCKHKKSEN